jgi:glycine cleavage system aminomethyltransferase T
MIGSGGFNRRVTEEQREFIFGERSISFFEGDSILIGLLRSGIHPTNGGCLCLAGDCPHCLATVDGISYTRTCQVKALQGMVVASHPSDQLPEFEAGSVQPPPAAACRHIHCDVVVIGMGSAGREAAAAAQSAGKRVATLDFSAGQRAVGIYPGTVVVAHTDSGIVKFHCAEEVIVATGASEIQPVCPGNLLTGIYTRRAVEALIAAGIDPGSLVAIGEPPQQVACEIAQGDLVRFEGTGRVNAVVVRDGQGHDVRVSCDSVALDLGLQPRNVLARMAAGLPVRSVGDAAREPVIPPCPTTGLVCPCSGVTVADLESVWDRGFQELELVKRATLAGTGPCQGALCVPYVRSFLAQRGGTLQAPFTARPVAWQLTIGDAAAGAYHRATARTALDGEHWRLGAHMERSSGWWRPWTYGIPEQEYRAVRQAVSICDIGTLGKFMVSGPDALELLERIYPIGMADLKPGRLRYALLLNERGYVMDDGIIGRDTDTSFYLTFSSGGSANAESWMRDWIDVWKLDVRLMNQTVSLGAINVTGPLASELLARAGCSIPPEYMGHGMMTVAGIPCRVCRLSFTGEVSYELHHCASRSVDLWRELLLLGETLGVKPHGVGTLLKLRLEKGHILVGQDSDFDSTPRRLNYSWAVKLDKSDFLGKQALLRTGTIPLDRRLAGFEIAGPSPCEGAVIWHNGEYAGYVTSSTWSPSLGKSVMLGWLRFFGDQLPDQVTIGGLPARRVPTPFYDPEGLRARV